MGDADVRYYRVSPKFWVDNTHWSDDARLLALYLLTSPHRNTEGFYRLPKPYAMGDLGWPPERFEEPFKQLLADGFIEYDDAAQVVLIVSAMKYQQCANDNVATAALKRLNELPETRLTSRFRQLAERFDERLAKRLPEQFGVAAPNTLALSLTQSPSPAKPPTGGEADERFDDFWGRYPKRNGSRGDKRKARTAFGRLTVDQQQTAAEHVDVYARWCKATDTLPCDATRYLHERRFDPDEHGTDYAEGLQAAAATQPVQYRGSGGVIG